MPDRRQVLSAFAGITLAGLARSEATPIELDVNNGVLRIAFGSCVSQRRPQRFWKEIASKDPQLFVMMGDGIYPEHEGERIAVLEAIERAYERARRRRELAAFRRAVPTIAIWDDNDYGGSDIGASFEHRLRSRELFLDFWTREPETTLRRRADGIYGSWEFGDLHRRTQIIVPDLRFNRSEWAQTEQNVRAALGESGFGPYHAVAGDDITMLGESQWRWLEECLHRPAALRILVSSIQLVPSGRGWESWSNFPEEKQRLYELIRASKADGMIVLSGDSHYGEISCERDDGVGYPLWEVTSSGLTESWPAPGPNPSRVGEAHTQTNFGLLTVNWQSSEPMLVAELYSTSGELLAQKSLLLSRLRHGA